MSLLYFLIFALLFLPIVLIIWGYAKGKREIYEYAEPTAFPKSFTSLFNSAVLYALAYNLIFFLQELFLAVGKQWIGLKAYLYHNNHRWEGSDPREDLMQGSGALGIFLIGVIMLSLWVKVRRSPGWRKLFILWLAYHGLMQSLPQVALAPVDRGTDVGAALTYFELGGTIDVGLAVISVVLIIGLAFLFSRWFLEMTPIGFDLDHPRARLMSNFYLSVLPALIGTLLIFPFRIPPLHSFIAPCMLLFIGLPWVWAWSWMGRTPEQMDASVGRKLHAVPIVMLVLLLIFFQVVLAPGVYLE